MSDSNEKVAEESAPETLPAAVELQNAVKERVGVAEKGDSSAKERVVNSLVEVELNSRAKVLSEALVKRKALQVSVKKAKPDNVLLDAQGNKTETFTQVKFKERKKLVDGLAKLDKAINTVISDPNADAYEKLKNFKG